MLINDPTAPDKFTKFVLPVLALLIPGAVTAASKWVLDHSHQRRSAELTERVSTLAKNISELPVLPLSNINPNITPQSALTAELEATLHELTALQIRARRSFSGVTSITSAVRSALLLFRPQGATAWILHLCFYAYLPCFIFVLSAGWAGAVLPQAGDTGGTASNIIFGLIFFFTAFGILGIPPLIIRHFAVKIHRRQCAEAQAAASKR
ncbi:MAG: hypothetical protein ABSD72_12725 [Terracidiphilus sp.]|jgi:hypothetical protein